ncbi:hypothetical protein ACP70R_025271 [Stipagrostis hirtigluma subsp. patula]
MSDWSGLHEDLLLLVVGRLPVLDLLRFRAVCASWRAAAVFFAAGRGRPRPDRPWLLLPTDDAAADPGRGRLVVSRDLEVPVVTLPARLGRVNPRRFVPLGSARGAIVAADDRGQMHLLDLVTGARKPLPPVATLPLVDRVEQGPAGLQVLHRGRVARIDGLIHKAVPVPTPGGGVMVVAIYRQQQHRNQWATARPGDRAWKSVAPTSIPAVVDVVVHKGQLYANTRYGMMYVFPELRGLGSASPEIIPSVTRRPSAYVERSFLVESPRGELMQVELLRPVAAAGGEGFVVRVLDECSETWEETEDIGDAAVLVDAAGAVAASTTECPALRPNTVYFAVDLEGETRVWAYSLAGKHKRIDVVEALPTAEGYKPPCFWFAPVYSQP